MTKKYYGHISPKFFVTGQYVNIHKISGVKPKILSPLGIVSCTELYYSDSTYG